MIKISKIIKNFSINLSRIRNKEGSILILGLLMMAILLLIGGIFLSLTLTNYGNIMVTSEDLQADYIARAGLNRVLHDLQEDFGTHANQLIEVPFATGKYKIGTYTIATRGIRDILVVSVGISSKSKSSLVTMVSIISPTDYQLFVDGNEQFDPDYRFPSYAFTGPIRMNGNLTVGVQVYGGTTNTKYFLVMKPKNLRGAVISLSGRMVYTGITTLGVSSNHPYQQDKVMAGVGEVIPSSQFASGFDDFKFEGTPLIFGEATGIVPPATQGADYSLSIKDYYPKNVTTGPMSELTGDGILEDGEHNGQILRVPHIDKFTIDTIRDYIDPNWMINDLTFSRYGVTQIGIVNDNLTKKDVIGKGDGSSYTFNYTPQDRKIKHLYYMKDIPETRKYKDGTPVVVAGFIDPKQNMPSPYLDLNPAPGTSDDSFVSTENGMLVIHNADRWKRMYLLWDTTANISYGRLGDANGSWMNYSADPTETEAITEHEKRINIHSTLMSMDREVRAVGFAPGPNDTRTTPTYIVPSSYYDVVVRGIPDRRIGWGVKAIQLKQPPNLPLTMGPFTGNGVIDKYEIPEKYYWVAYLPDGTGKNNAVKIDGVAQTEAPYYNGENSYYINTSPYSSYATQADQDVFLSGYGFHRYYDGTKTYVKLSPSAVSAANGKTIEIKLGRWWFPDKVNEPNNNCTALFVQQYPPSVDTWILTDPYIKCLKIDLNRINEDTVPKDPSYPLGFADYNNNGQRDAGEPSKYGIIYSKVPLVVGGTPKVPVTIVCEEDVYLQGINDIYPDDSNEANPVGILSKKVVWVLHSDENTKSGREVVLNKVVIMTRGDMLFDHGGLGIWNYSLTGGDTGSGWIANKTKIVGTIWKAKVDSNGSNISLRSASSPLTQWYVDADQMKNDPYIYVFDSRIYGNMYVANQFRFAQSLRITSPPHIPNDYRKLGIRPAGVNQVDKFFNQLSKYLKEGINLTSNNYQELIDILQ